MSTIEKILEGTFVAILIYLVVTNAIGFSSIVGTTGNVYVNSIKALQGR